MRDDDFVFGSRSDHARVIFLLAEALEGVSAQILSFKISWQAQYLLALLIGNDASYVMRINDAIHFAGQAQYLVKLEGDLACSAHWK